MKKNHLMRQVSAWAETDFSAKDRQGESSLGEYLIPYVFLMSLAHLQQMNGMNKKASR